MIQKFLVEVKRHSVIVYHEDDLSNVHYRAQIDGWDYAYQIIPSRMSFSKPLGDWFKHGGQQVHYHAKNQGESIQWLPVTQDFMYRVMAKANRSEIEKAQLFRLRKNHYE